MARKMKTNVRLLRAEDAIWMFCARCYPEYVDKEWTSVLIGSRGFVMSAVFGFDDAGDPDMHRISADWNSVADGLGMKKCEYVTDPDGIKCVLMYDEETTDKKGT